MTQVQGADALQAASESKNFYELLSLNREASTSELRGDLARIKLQWTNKAARAGAAGDRARQNLEHVKLAELVFTDDETRDEYDLSLIRTAEPSEQSIDWLARAWNYYFLEEDGPAAVAARKAREAEPENPIPFVVSAWVKIRDGEFKQAKHDSDEALVLDELGEDTVDVHHVRGAVYVFLEDYDRALRSLDRALARAGQGERPELLVWKAQALDGLGRHAEAFECCEEGLSLPVEVVEVIGRALAARAAVDIARLAEVEDNSWLSIENYERWAERIQRGDIRHPARGLLTTYIDGRIQKHRDVRAIRKHLDDLHVRQLELRAIVDASGSRPGIPVLPIGIGGLLLFLGGLWEVLPIVGVAVLVYAGFRIYKRVTWDQTRLAYAGAQADLEELQERIGRAQRDLGLAESLVLQMEL